MDNNITVLYTIGHGRRTMDEFLQALKTPSITTVVDVRAYPHSQRNPQFSLQALRQSLENAGVIYHWAGKQLGGRRQAKEESKHIAITDEQIRAYADYMESETFQKAVVQLINLAATDNTAILCAEKDPQRCHRSLISDYLLLRGIEVVHIIDQTTMLSHQLSPLARRESQQLIYDRGVTRPLSM